MYEKMKFFHVPEFRHRHSYLVSLLFAAPTTIIVQFLPLVYNSYNIIYNIIGVHELAHNYTQVPDLASIIIYISIIRISLCYMYM